MSDAGKNSSKIIHVKTTAKSANRSTIIKIHYKESLPDIAISKAAIEAHKNRGNTFADIEIFPEVDKNIEENIILDATGKKRFDIPVHRIHLVAVLPNTFPYYRLNSVAMGVSYYKDTVMRAYKHIQHIGHDAGLLYVGIGHHDKDRRIPRAMEIGDYKIVYGGVGFSLKGNLSKISIKKGYKIRENSGEHIPNILELLAILARAKDVDNDNISQDIVNTVRNNAQTLLQDFLKVQSIIKKNNVAHEIAKEIYGTESLILNTHILRESTAGNFPDLDDEVKDAIRNWYNKKIKDLKQIPPNSKNKPEEILTHTELRHIGWVADRAQAVEHTIKKALESSKRKSKNSDLEKSIRRVAYFLAGIPVKDIHLVGARESIETAMEILHRERVFLLPTYRLEYKASPTLQAKIPVRASSEKGKSRILEVVLAKREIKNMANIDNKNNDNARILEEYPGQPKVAIDSNGYVYLSAGKVLIPINVALARNPHSESQREILGVTRLDSILEGYPGLIRNQEKIHRIKYRNSSEDMPVHRTRDLLLIAARAMAEDNLESLLSEYVKVRGIHKQWVNNGAKSMEIPENLKKYAKLALKRFIREYAEHTWATLHDQGDRILEEGDSAKILTKMYLAVGGKNFENIDKIARIATNDACGACKESKKRMLNNLVREIGTQIHTEVFATHILQAIPVEIKIPEPPEQNKVLEMHNKIHVPENLRTILDNGKDTAIKQLKEAVYKHIQNKELPIPNAVDAVPIYTSECIYCISSPEESKGFVKRKIRPLQVARIENTAYAVLPHVMQKLLQKHQRA